MSEIRPFEHPAPDGIAVRGFLHAPDSPSGDALILTHGAGANCQAPLLFALGRTFADAGITVLRCDLPFRQARPHGPPPRGSAERDQQGLHHAVDALRPLALGRIFLGAHSYGGRQSSMLAAAQPGLVDGLLLLSYPLHPPQRPTEMRTAHFPSLQTPSLFVSGSRDGFGTSEELADALKLIPARTQHVVVPSAGHELLSKRNAQDLPQNILQYFQSFFPKP